MRILISNDDGIRAEGIQTLRRILEMDHEITVAAPQRQQSAMGHAITMHKALYAKPVVYGPKSRGFSINGTPADCVKLAVSALCETPPDLMMSGINHGSNLGRDGFYSGTVSAAMEAMFLGVPAIALSLEDGAEGGFEWAARFVRWWIGEPGFQMPPPGVVYNINFPSLRRGRPLELRVAALGGREYANDFRREVSASGRTVYWLGGERVDSFDDPATDVFQHHEGAVTLTPLHMHLTAFEMMAKLSSFSLPRLD